MAFTVFEDDLRGRERMALVFTDFRVGARTMKAYQDPLGPMVSGFTGGGGVLAPGQECLGLRGLGFWVQSSEFWT